MTMTRRGALKVLGAAARPPAPAVALPAEARTRQEARRPTTSGMLYDATRCIGCRACVDQVQARPTACRPT